MKSLGELVSGGTVEITRNGETLVYKFCSGEAYQRYFDADMAFQLVKRTRDKALGEPVTWPKGICDFWICDVDLTRDGNEYIKAGTQGDLNVIEVSSDRTTIIKALFHPVASKGYGLVVQPKFKRLKEVAIAAQINP